MFKNNYMELSFSNTAFLRVRYGETDQMGYCYYGNYAQYFEVGRVEALRELGLSYRRMEEQGIMLPVSEFNVRYLAPAFYDDQLKIVTHVRSVTGARILFDYEIFNEAGQKIATASTTLVFVNRENMRPTAPPPAFLNLLEHYAV